jgi:hypothetical protein
VQPSFQNITASRRNAHNAASTSHGNIGGAIRGTNNGGENERAVVVNVTVAVAAFFPSSVTDDGETVHIAAVGAPVQLQVTVPLKLFAGAAVTVRFAGLPAAMVVLAGAAETL